LLSGALMMLLTRQANAANTDYSQNGANWADVTTTTVKEGGQDVSKTVSNIVCKSGKTQGPIDLLSTTTPSKEKESYFHYENVIGDIDKKYIYTAAG
jgi:carbonic anhydrase